MNDTSVETQELHARPLAQRSGTERLRMALSMCDTARALVWESLPSDLTDAQRRCAFFLRFCGTDGDAAWREQAAAWLTARDGE